MDEHEFATTCVGVAMEQFNARLLALAEGRGAEVTRDEIGDRAVEIAGDDPRPLLMVGLDVELRALDGVTHDHAHALGEELAEAILTTGKIPCGPMQRALEALFVTGCLHERERARREAEGGA